ncbi:hypothetical protein GUJ93_ZPchr0006g40626 [Zizania palustris]|uniref:Uncharacterized protein n=1 Tax=Zizania palustris TaxID=103762 RepID=A0A8J5SGM8_ZIZPA|nr:hypothetical protein GUJ93_ZPchr0006g40626 [Zizania palustris]
MWCTASIPYPYPYLDVTDIDVRIPMFAYLSREKRSGYDHNKKAGAMNAMAIREAMCYMLDRGGDCICYIQFPQRFEGIDPSDRYANHNTVFFDGNMRALDGLLQGPMYVGTGCLFRRYAMHLRLQPAARQRVPRARRLRPEGQTKVPIDPQYARQGGGDGGVEELRPMSEHPDHEGPQRLGVGRRRHACRH